MVTGLNSQSGGDATKLEILPPLSQGENVALRGDYVVSIGDVFPETVPKSLLSDTDFLYEFLDDFGTESVYFLSVEAERADNSVTSKEASEVVSLKSIFENRNPVRHDLESSIKELKREEKKRLNQEMAMRDGRVAIQQHLQYEWLNLKRLREVEDELKSDPLKGSEYYGRLVDIKDKMEAVCSTITELLLSESKKAAYEQYIHSTREAIQEQISHRKQLKLGEVDKLPTAASKESVESDSLSESASKSSHEYLSELDESNLLSVKRVFVSGSFEKPPAAAAELTREQDVRRDDSGDTVTGEASKGE
ncbi:hypothetical protein EB796_013211 [Bugula neritina]|uniref:Uncharacterized protein n=1 Tax=Bugula neritina TaxID=10212 RepID=A0A7J7JRD8_BUGNE|nr:hypothetical protein EB796_013211 [Bugula neritina]